MKKRIGIDVGGSKIRAIVGGSKEVISEPSAVALDNDNGKVIACGREALFTAGRVPGSVKVVYPFSGEYAPNADQAGALLTYLLKKLKVRNPDVFVSYSGKQSKESEKIIVRAIQAAGADDVAAVDPAYAAACGCGVDGMGENMIANIGATVTDIAAYCHSKLAAKRTNAFAGNAIDKAISIAIFRKYRMSITPEDAERAKLACASLTSSDDTVFILPATKPTVGLPFRIELKKSEICNFIEPVTDELFDDLIEITRNLAVEPDKIVLTGGTALLDGIAPVLQSLVHIPVRVADNPSEAVIRGLYHIIEAENS